MQRNVYIYICIPMYNCLKALAKIISKSLKTPCPTNCKLFTVEGWRYTARYAHVVYSRFYIFTHVHLHIGLGLHMFA
jgi:hypothetical protein